MNRNSGDANLSTSCCSDFCVDRSNLFCIKKQSNWRIVSRRRCIDCSTPKQWKIYSILCMHAHTHALMHACIHTHCNVPYAALKLCMGAGWYQSVSSEWKMIVKFLILSNTLSQLKFHDGVFKQTDQSIINQYIYNALVKHYCLLV